MTRARLLVLVGVALAVLVCLAVAFLIRRPAVDLPAARDRIGVGMPEPDVLALVGRAADRHTDYGRPGPRFLWGEAAYRLTWFENGATLAVKFGRDGRAVTTPHWSPPRPGLLRQVRNWLAVRLALRQTVPGTIPGTVPARPRPALGTAPQRDGS